MTPTFRAAAALVALAVVAPFVSPWLSLAALAALLTATVFDAALVRAEPPLHRAAPAVLVRGQRARLHAELAERPPGRVRLRQPFGPDLALEPSEADGPLDAELVGLRRGRHALPPLAVRLSGPLGLGAWTHRGGATEELRVFPDLPGARRLAADVRAGRFREDGRRPHGALGLGTDFETLRDYAPDDDVRQVNWLATARAGRPISNQFRFETDRDVVCLLDSGRLSAAPVGAATRLDLAIDAAVAVAAVAEVLGDRCGTIAFAAELRRSVLPRRAAARQIVEALFDLEPLTVESDFARAFLELAPLKRGFVLVFTDLIEPVAARPLVEALPTLSRRHAVAVVSVADPDLAAAANRPPSSAEEVYELAVALEVLDERARVSAELRRAGADVVEAAPERLAAACVSAYLRAKRRARV